MTRVQYVLLGLALCVFTACSGGGGSSDNGQPDTPQPDIPVSPVNNKMTYESAVPRDHVAAFDESISYLYAKPLSDDGSYVLSEMKRYMSISDVNPSTLQDWLEERVHIIVNQDFTDRVDSLISLGASPYAYPYPTEFPDAIHGGSHLFSSPSLVGQSAMQVMMLNIGSAIYLYGKKQARLINLQISGVGNVAVTSPRLGLLEIGEGLFPDLNGTRVQNILLDILRVSTLFHEARHSDGHGKTAGFLHATCPSGTYEGKAACDASTNGPYTIGADVLRALLDQCGSDCTELTTSALSTLYYDEADRTLDATELPNTSPGAKAGTAWDDAPEGHVN